MRRSRIEIRRCRQGSLSGWCLETRRLRMMLVTSRGPRIASLGLPGGESILYWAPGAHRHGEWDMLGGHRLWVTRPGADEAEETYRPDNEPCRVERSARGVRATAPVDPVTCLERSLEVELTGVERVRVTHRLRNAGSMLWSGGLWALTATAARPEVCYFAPLANESSWETATLVLFRRWGLTHEGAFADPQFGFTSDALVVRAEGRENKRMLGATPGVLAMHCPERGVLFLKHAQFTPGGAYPLGANLAIYTSPDGAMVELETLGPQATLKPGEGLEHVEHWRLEPWGLDAPRTPQLLELAQER